MLSERNDSVRIPATRMRYTLRAFKLDLEHAQASKVYTYVKVRRYDAPYTSWKSADNLERAEPLAVMWLACLYIVCVCVCRFGTANIAQIV